MRESEPPWLAAARVVKSWASEGESAVRVVESQPPWLTTVIVVDSGAGERINLPLVGSSESEEDWGW